MKIKIGKKEWEEIGKKARWTKKAQDVNPTLNKATLQSFIDKLSPIWKNIVNISKTNGIQAWEIFMREYLPLVKQMKDLEEFKSKGKPAAIFLQEAGIYNINFIDSLSKKHGF